MRPTLAIIGTGITGLGAAHFLHRDYDLTIFESDTRIGGHTYTLELETDGRRVAFDTGFMVFNRVTYPNLVRLFETLGVPFEPTDMSFSVQHRARDIEYSGSSLNHLFAQRSNLLKPAYYRFLLAINQFNREALDVLAADSEEETLAEFVQKRGYGEDFRDLFLIPMSGAVWSTPPEKMLQFPALTLIRFFHNHGFLGLNTQHQWFTVTGGSSSYVPPLTAPFRDRIRSGCGVQQVRRTAEGVFLRTSDGAETRFDKVLFACHADQALALLETPTPREAEWLGPFRYEDNPTIIHTDESVMPRRRLAWAAWNYRIARHPDGRWHNNTHYWMNRLQHLPGPVNYFVSLNAESLVDPALIRHRIAYTHPLFDLASIRAQRELPALNRISPDQSTYFAGSYFRYGFHEDALASALAACEHLLQRDPWSAA